MPLRFRKFTAHQQAHGFTLIESAIVLGIVGLVVAGIWIASQALSQKAALAKANEGLIQLAQNIQNNLTITQASQIGNGTYIANTARKAGWVPADWIRNNQIAFPLGAPLDYMSVWGPQWRVQIGLTGLTQDVCMQLITQFTSRYNSSNSGSNAYSSGGLVDVFWYTLGGASTGTNSFPLTGTATQCPYTTNSNTLFFTFALTRT